MDLSGADGILMGVTALTSALATQFFNYLHRKRQEDQKHENDEDDRVIAGYQLTINKLDARIATLEKAYDNIRKEHVDCIIVQAELRGEIAALHKQIGNNPNPAHILPSDKPPPLAPPPFVNSPHITPHNPPQIPTRSIEPLDQK